MLLGRNHLIPWNVSLEYCLAQAWVWKEGSRRSAVSPQKEVALEVKGEGQERQEKEEEKSES